MNETIPSTSQMYLEFFISDPSSKDKPQLFLLPTKVISTVPPATSTRSHRSNTPTTRSESNSKIPASISTSKSPAITEKQVEFFKVVKYEESPIPNGVKRQWNIVFNVSTGNAKDCEKTVYLCRQKTDANIPQCVYDEIILTDLVNSCQFFLEYNDTMNETISSTSQMYLEFFISDPSSKHKPQLFLLPTKVISTVPPATTTRSHRSNTPTTTSESNSKIPASISTSKSPAITEKQVTSTVPPATSTRSHRSQTPTTTSEFNSKIRATITISNSPTIMGKQGHPYPTTTQSPESLISARSTMSNAVNQSTTTSSNTTSLSVSVVTIVLIVVGIVLVILC
ncbi:integumentary mucin C.1-like [Dendronephthya gigantea]|uniref:integumentary mucin C.1-like n=1 Tax=Dendronephthya gigantea TaxID=151771 RepID=UPI00106AFF9F|nr:integumentary mucin C.1-like [Dendronephthya gigantea]